MKSKIIAIVLFCFLIIPVHGFATDYYANTSTGSDSGTGLSGDPWRVATSSALMTKLASLSPGDMIHLKCGDSWSYTEDTLVIDESGTSGNNIGLGAYYGADGSETNEEDDPTPNSSLCGNSAVKPIIGNSGGKGAGSTLSITGDYVELNSISVQQGWSGIHIDNSDYDYVLYCYVYDSTQGIYVGESNLTTHITVNYNLVNLNDDGSDDNEPIDTNDAILFRKVSYSTANYNIVTNFDHGGITFSDAGNAHNTGNNNLCYDYGQHVENACFGLGVTQHSDMSYNRAIGAKYSAEIIGSRNGTFTYNVLYGVRGVGEPHGLIGMNPCLHIGCYEYHNTSDNLIANNTLRDNDVDSGEYGISFYANATTENQPPEEGGDSHGNMFINNIVEKLGSSGTCIIIEETGSLIGTNYFYNNNCYNYGTTYANIEGSTYSSASLFNARSDATGNIEVNPYMTDPDNGDFSLGGSSTLGTLGYSGSEVSSYNQGIASDSSIPPNPVSTLDQGVYGWSIGAYVDAASESSGNLPISNVGYGGLSISNEGSGGLTVN